ncbi:MAG: hypothetical protein IKT61_03925 [Clostridia bacterium]|nr:hypothetical protein [Clostridia bacterium]
MKKLISILLLVVISVTFFACDKKDGDLGKQTTVDAENGYTLVQEVKPFEFSEDEDELQYIESGMRIKGFNVTPENAKGAIKVKADVVEIARQEATEEYNQIQLFYDRTRGIWKAKLQNVTEYEASDGSFNRTTGTVETIYIDEDGYTLFAVK